MRDLFSDPGTAKTLRPHQERALAMLKSSLAGKAHRAPVLQLATGAGKTRIAAEIINGALSKGNRVAFTVPAISLVDQTVQALEDEGITRINVATYQSTSGAGRSGMEELGRQTAELLNFQSPEPKKFQAQIAFNLIPQIDDFLDNGYTKEEMKLVWETRKILGDDTIQVNPTAVRVPVFYGHSEAVNIETRQKISAEAVRALLAVAPGVEVVDEREPGGYPTPVTHASGNDPVYVGRIREDVSHPSAINLWIVADNIRKGAALNAVQIAELIASGG